jgi:ribosome-associated heat shock protein Hsp15
VNGLRLDKWLWAARFFKTRGLANEAVDNGKVKLNGAPTKPAHDIKPGDRLEIRHGDRRSEIIVAALSDKRGPASAAQQLYTETTASVAAREAEQQHRQFSAEPAAAIYGRPTKRDRRRLERLNTD